VQIRGVLIYSSPWQIESSVDRIDKGDALMQCNGGVDMMWTKAPLQGFLNPTNAGMLSKEFDKM
jgi:hypothetical protein